MVKHDKNRFDQNRINIVFVGSGFTSADDWSDQVAQSYATFTNYNMFSPSNERVNFFFAETMTDSFCEYNCRGVDRLLCCDVETAKALASKCFSSYSNMQTIVIHNDEKYGGAGYKNSNIATISRNKSGPLIAIHELGHSLFELESEYSYGVGTSDGANCDNKGCGKWADFIGNDVITSEYGEVSCLPGCQGNNYFVGQPSFMEYLSSPVGAVNERFTCCTFKAFTNGFPAYCDIFDFSPGDLQAFCDMDYQNYGITTEDGIVAKESTTEYTHIHEPLMVTILLNEDNPEVKNKVRSHSGLFHTKTVGRQRDQVSEIMNNSTKQVVEVTVFLKKGGKKVLYFSDHISVTIPPNEGDVSSYSNQRDVRFRTDVLEIVMGRASEVTDISAKYISFS